MDDAAQDEWFASISAAVVLYAAMLGATVAGQVGGIAVDALVHSHGIAIPLSCSVVLEALAGARAGAARAGRALTPAESGRISVKYSLGLAGLSLVLGVWILAARPAGSALFPVTFLRGVLAVAILAFATAARWALMSAFAPRRP